MTESTFQERLQVSTTTREIRDCEVCGSKTLLPVLDLGLHPMCDDLVPIGDSRVCREYPIDILFCETCRTAHQRYQVPKRDLFPASYHYRARFTKDVLDGMRELVDVAETRLGPLRRRTVLDIGCNDGSLLGFFRERGATTVGIEPTGAALDAKAEGHTVFNDYFSEDIAHQVVAACGHPDLITFTNVFAHIEHLAQVLDAVRVLMGPSTALIIENHYLGSVLDRNQFDTFYHEHPRSYSYTSFGWIARQLNASIQHVEFPQRYAGNIRVVLQTGCVAAEVAPQLLEREARFAQQFASMRENIVRWRRRRGLVIDEAVKRHGRLQGKAFPGRSAILVKLLDLDERSISQIHEKPGSLKIGHYVPGTRIPITSDDELFASEDRSAPILNFAWHIAREIRAYLHEHGVTGEVIDIMTPEDFA